MDKKNKAPQKSIKSIDISQVVYKYEPKKNPYIRTASYRKLPPKSQEGSNAEIY
jgi:hypothetical protein